MAHEPRKLRQIVRHEGNIGRFNGGVAAHGAHGDAEIGPTHRGSIVDPVADHRHRSVTPHQVLDRRYLIAGQKFRPDLIDARLLRSEEHTSELQSLMRISYAVFCLKKKTKT